jgi:hypothetical protein
VRASRITSLSLLLALALPALLTRSVAAQSAAGEVDLRSPAQRSTRYSAYSLPKGMWSVEVGALGMGDELYGLFGGNYGLGEGFQIGLNLVHYATGLFNINARWNFLDREHLGLGVAVGFDYGHGAWVWVLDPLAQELVQDTDLFAVPISLTASVPLLPWLQFDLPVEYQYAAIFGTLGEGRSFYAEAQIGARQVRFRPGARFFLSKATAFEFGAILPAYTRVPFEGEITAELANQGYERSGSGEASVRFSETWNIEVGLRSSIRPWLFCAIRLDYGPRADVLYGALVYPSFSLEFRL